MSDSNYLATKNNQLYIGAEIISDPADMTLASFEGTGKLKEESNEATVWRGSYDNIFIYNRDLSQREIQTLDNEGLQYDIMKSTDSRYIEGLYAYYRFEYLDNPVQMLEDQVGRFPLESPFVFDSNLD